MDLLLVDDEPQALELLLGYAARFPGVRVAGTCRSATEAIAFLGQHTVDAVLLDISMPGITGMQLADQLRGRIPVVFTTAHAEYAVRSYDMHAVDYLLKPISFDRFTQAVQKLMDGGRTAPAPSGPLQSMLFLKSGSTFHRVPLTAIDRLEKDGNYMVYYYEGKRLLVRQTVEEAMALLPSTFVRVHRSHIVPLDRVGTVELHQVKVGDRSIPVSALYRDDLMAHIGAQEGRDEA